MILSALTATLALVVRVVAVTGTPQAAHAWAAVGEKRYYAEFPVLLVARWNGRVSNDGERMVRFTCITRGCSFQPTDQPDEGEYVSRIKHVQNAYDVRVIDGKAVLRVTIEGDTIGEYLVRAAPVLHGRERGKAATFRLTLR